MNESRIGGPTLLSYLLTRRRYSQRSPIEFQGERSFEQFD